MNNLCAYCALNRRKILLVPRKNFARVKQCAVRTDYIALGRHILHNLKLMSVQALERKTLSSTASLGEGQAERDILFSEDPSLSLEDFPIGLYTSTLDGQILEVNQALLEILEAPNREAILGKRGFDFYVNPEDRERLLALLANSPQVKNFETKLRTFKGHHIWVTISARLVQKDGQTLLRGALQDITALRFAQQALTETEAKFRAISELAPDAIVILDLDGHITFWNQAAEKIFGFQQGEILGQSFKALLATERYYHYYKRALELLKNGRDRLSGKRFRIKAQRKNGNIFPVAISHNVIQVDHHPVLLCNIRDISAEERAKKYIKRREEILKAVSHLAGIFLHSLSYQEALEQGFQLLGNILNLSHIVLYRSISEGDRNFLSIQQVWKQGQEQGEKFFTNGDLALLEDLLQKDLKKITTLTYSSLDNKKRALLEHKGVRTVAISPIFVDGQCWGFIEFAHAREKNWSNVELYALRSITDMLGVAIQRERFSEELIREKEQLDITLASIADGVMVTDTWGRLLLINRGAQKLLKLEINPKEEEIFLEEIFNIFYEKTRQPENILDSVLQHQRTVRLVSEIILINHHGDEIPVQIVASPVKNRERQIVGVVIVFQDITRRRQVEQEILNQEKMKILEMLAGGIAHDFNNLLVAILGNLSLAKVKNQQENVGTHLERAEKAAKQAEKLTRQLLTFTKGGLPAKKTTSVRELVQETVSFVLRGSNVKVRFAIPENLWPARVDEVQISQVIQNLVINAQQAMPEGGLIEIIAQNSEINGDTEIPLPPGPYIKIEVKDQGCGIPSENLGRIFDPYFTTKDEGTGLGLAVVLSIIKKHQGYIRVHSTVGQGTTFEIYLPAERESAQPIPSDPLPQEISPQRTSKGRILVLDDEELIRETLSEMLTLLGYEVETASEGLEAVEKYKRALEQDARFDLIIMDLTIPGGMGGKETIQEILKIDPLAVAVVSSGYSSNDILSGYQAYGFQGVLKKPYRLEELVSTIEEVLKNRA